MKLNCDELESIRCIFDFGQSRKCASIRERSLSPTVRVGMGGYRPAPKRISTGLIVNLFLSMRKPSSGRRKVVVLLCIFLRRRGTDYEPDVVLLDSSVREAAGMIPNA
jgi:hypothetical protein